MDRDKLINLLREMSAQQSKTDNAGGREVAWWYWQGEIEEALDVPPGTFDPPEED